MASYVIRAREQVQPVLVEYTFHDVSETKINDLPSQVENAVETLVGRERLPSDENVRDFIRQNRGGDEDDNDARVHDVSVQIMLPHSVAIEVALDRSFRHEQPLPRLELTPTDLRVLTRRSVRARLRSLRRRLRRESIVPKETITCIICLEQIRHTSNRITLECGHDFHRNCVVEWLAETPRRCPTCRQEIDLTPKLDEQHLTMASRTRSSTANACSNEE